VKVPEMISAMDQILPGIMDLSYKAIQRFFKVALSGWGPPTAAPFANQVLSVEVTKTVNKNKHTYMSTTKLHFKEHRRSRESGGIEHSTTYQNWDRHGLDVMGIFRHADSC
jgi:hypothetical protein